MLRRLLGLILIISILMPLVLGAAGFFVIRQIVADIEDAARGPLQRLNARLQQLRGTLDTIRQTFEGLSSLIASIGSKLGGLTSGLRLAINSLSVQVPALSIPDIRFRFPDPIGRQVIPVPDIPGFELVGLRQIKDVLSSMHDLFGNLTDAFRRIVTLQTLTRELNDIVTDVRDLTDAIGQIGAGWLNTLTLIAIVFAIWIAAVYVALTYRWLSTGWRMLQGNE